MENQYTVFVGDGGWRVGAAQGGKARVSPVPSADGTTIADRVVAVKQQLDSMGYASQPVVLAPASSWCMCVAISTESLDRGGRRREMAFRLEEHLPISAEDVVADYVDAGEGEALGVCVERKRLQELVDAFEAGGVKVRHICPAGLLAAAYATDLHGDIDGVLLIDRGQDGEVSPPGYDLVELRNGRPARWWWFAQDASAASERVAAWSASRERSVRLAAIGCAESVLRGDMAAGRVERINLADISPDEAAANFAERVHAGAASPWVDLRRDALAGPDGSLIYRKPVVALTAAVVLLLVCVLAAMQWRGRKYDAMSREYQRQQVAVFREALPGQREPGDVRGRLFSEHRRLTMLEGRGADGKNGAAVGPGPAMSHLRELLKSLKSLPDDMRYRILDLNIQPDMIRVDGQARNLVEADRVAAALRESGVYEVELPRKQAIREGEVSFLFTAKPRAGLVAPQGGR